MWISRLIRDGSGRIVDSTLEFAADHKRRTGERTGAIRNLLDEVSEREAAGADRVRRSVADSTESGPEPTAPPMTRVRKELGVPDLTSMPDLRTFLRGSAADNKRLEAILSGLNHRYGPYDVHIAKADYLDDGNGFTYHASIRDPTRGTTPAESIVGILERKISVDDQGRIVVENRMMDLDEDATGQGFATAFNSAMETYYRRSGVDRVTVFATDDGGYVWARAGYDFDTSPGRLESSVSSITDNIRSIYNECSDADRAQLDDMLSRFEGRVIEYPSPSELAALTGDDPKLGKKVMVETAWYGVRVL